MGFDADAVEREDGGDAEPDADDDERPAERAMIRAEAGEQAKAGQSAAACSTCHLRSR
jgi:hypothetical protein